MSDHLDRMAIGALAIDPSQQSVIYAGTGEANGSGDSYGGDGLYKSADSGAKWTHVTAIQDSSGNPVDLIGMNISSVVVTKNRDVYFSVTGSADFTCAPICDGIYVSTNAGSSFTQRLSSQGISSLAADLANQAVLFAGGDEGVWKTTKYGSAWNLALNLTAVSPARVQVAVAPSNHSVIYAIAADSGSKGSPPGIDGFFRSNDGGRGWAAILIQMPADFCGSGSDIQCSYDLTLAVAPWDSNVAYAGGVYLVQFILTTNPKANTLGKGSNGIHVDFHALAFDPSNALWVGNDGGVYRSAKADDSFTDLNANLTISEFEPGLSVTHDVIVGGLQDNGTVASQGSKSWVELFGGDGGYAAADPTNPQVIYATSPTTDDNGGTYSGIYKTTDDGASRCCDFPEMTPTQSGKPYGGDSTLMYAPMVMSPNTPSTLYAGSTRLWRTTDASSSWTPSSQLGSQGDEISAIGTLMGGDSTLYAGTAGGHVWVSGDANTSFTWREITTSALPPTFVTHITVVSSSEAYVTFGGFGYGHVYHTVDTGKTWQNDSGDLVDIPTNSLVVVGSTLVIGTDIGVFASQAGSGTWRWLDNPLPDVVVMDLVASNGLLWAATHGRGVWTLPLPSVLPATMAWGENVAGELGNGTTSTTGCYCIDTPVGVKLPSGAKVTALAAGSAYSIALTSTGSVLAWGYNGDGNLGNGGATGNTDVPVSVKVPNGTIVTAIAAGADHVLALTSTGSILAWGLNLQGQLGTGTVTVDSTVPVPVNLPTGTTVTAIAAGAGHSLALTSTGSILAWGYNASGELGTGTTSTTGCFCVDTPVAVALRSGTTATSIAAGSSHSLAGTSTGSVLAWGDNSYGELGNGTTSTTGCFCIDTPVAVKLSSGTSVTAIAAGSYYSVALTSTSPALAWGDNSIGELGNGTISTTGCFCINTPVAVKLASGTTVLEMAASLDGHSLALTSTGSVIGWGNNLYGEVGDGTTVNRDAPVLAQLPHGSDVTAIAAGDGHSLALTS